jgi:hypothetical protein
MSKNKSNKTNCCFFAVTRVEKTENDMFPFIYTLYRKTKICFYPKRFLVLKTGWRERKHGKVLSLLMEKALSNYKRAKICLQLPDTLALQLQLR